MTKKTADAVRYTVAEWRAKAAELFGATMNWAFICPACGHIATVRDWMESGAPETAVAFSCVGRWKPGGARDAFGKGPGPCDYAGGGLIGLNPVIVTDDEGKEMHAFDFAPAQLAQTTEPDESPATVAG